MNPKEYKCFMMTLEQWNAKYDDEVKMIKRPFSSPGYHTTLKGGYVHSTREALTYAVALLDSGIEEYRLRAVEVIDKVISLQDTNPENKTYGIWSWFYEEPLAMMAPPDWNWADFCGKELLQVALDHSARVPQELMTRVKDAIIHACKSIIRRNMGPHYTNIAIMGTYVTLVAGEHFNDKEILNYAKERLKNLHRYNMKNGAFTEYNSPTYTMIALEDLSRLMKHVKDKECLKLIEDMFDMGWSCVAKHFHVTTKQWAGPHGRCYSTLNGKTLWSKLQLTLDNKINFLQQEDIEVQLETFRIGLKCPEKFINFFAGLEEPREIREMFIKGDGERRAEAATTYLCKEFTLGTFYKSDFWNQKRALLAYLGEAEKPVYMHLRCLHDGYDYASGAIHTVQSKGRTLSIINFSTDGGDTHCNLDLVKDATIKAKDFRLRMEIGGAVDDIRVKEQWEENYIQCISTDVVIDIKIPYCTFGDNEVKYEVTRSESSIFIDIVLYRGEENNICFSELNEAVCCIAVDMDVCSGANNKRISEISTYLEEKLLTAVWKEEKENLIIEAGVKADTFKVLYDLSRGMINDKQYEEIMLKC